MAINFEQFFQSITQQESGGNYSALGIWLNMNYGRDRAYGRYQVMGANIPSWTKQYLGRSLTPQQYLNDRDAQDRVARGRLREYVNKYGYRGAAAAWYSGDPSLHMSTSSQAGGPSIKQYVDEVMARAETLPSGGGSTATTTTTRTTRSSSDTGGGEKPVTRSKEELAEDYGYVLDLFDSVPELKKLFDRATDGQWTPQKFQAEVRDTEWWKSRPDSARKFLILQSGDPATAKQQLDQMIVKISQVSGAVGGPMDQKTLRKLAFEAIMNNWTDGQMRYELAKRVDMGGGRRPGEAGEAYDKLASYAYEMGVKMSDAWYQSVSRTIAAGTGSLQQYEDAIRQQAKAQYSNWSKQIDSGQTVADLASPYFQSMATILELPPGSVNLFDPTIKKALQSKDSQGKSTIKPMWQFENELRNDPRWRKTKNAQDSAMQVTRQVLTDFGFAY